MIHFFRIVRKNLLTENRLRRYFIYAFGEIALVVLGILIALQINVWRQENILSAREQTYLVELNDEFKDNLNLLNVAIEINQSNLEGGKHFIELFNSEQSKLEDTLLSKLIIKALSTTIEYRPNNSVLNEMTSSGSIMNLSNKELKRHLVSWKPDLEQIVIQENLVELYRRRCLHLILEKGSLRTVFDDTKISTDFLELSKTKTVQYKNLDLLKLNRLENEFLTFVLSSQILEVEFHKECKKDIENILNLIEKEINKE